MWSEKFQKLSLTTSGVGLTRSGRWLSHPPMAPSTSSPCGPRPVRPSPGTRRSWPAGPARWPSSMSPFRACEPCRRWAASWDEPWPSWLPAARRRPPKRPSPLSKRCGPSPVCAEALVQQRRMNLHWPGRSCPTRALPGQSHAGARAPRGPNLAFQGSILSEPTRRCTRPPSPPHGQRCVPPALSGRQGPLRDCAGAALLAGAAPHP